MKTKIYEVVRAVPVAEGSKYATLVRERFDSIEGAAQRFLEAEDAISAYSVKSTS